MSRTEFIVLIYSITVSLSYCEWVEIPKIRPPMRRLPIEATTQPQHTTELLEGSDFINRLLHQTKITSISVRPEVTVDEVFSGIKDDVEQLRKSYIETTGSTKISDKMDFVLRKRAKHVRGNMTESFREHSHYPGIFEESAAMDEDTSIEKHNKQSVIIEDSGHSGKVEEIRGHVNFEPDNENDYVAEPENDYDNEDENEDGNAGEDDESDETSESMESTSSKPKLQRRVIKIIHVKPKYDEVLSLANFLKYLKSIQEAFVAKTKSGIKDKMKILNNFKNELLLNIKNRMMSLWPQKLTRRKRGILDYDKHDSLDFPSAEGALLTISFLTFAVFLIKLVLQVIKTVKSKHYSFNGLDGTTISAIKAVKHNRNARKLSYTEEDIRNTANMMQSIENFKSN